jgi:hypothetical protein
MKKIFVLGCLVLTCNISQGQSTQDSTKLIVIEKVEKPKQQNTFWDFVLGVTERVTSTVLAFYILK